MKNYELDDAPIIIEIPSLSLDEPVAEKRNTMRIFASSAGNFCIQYNLSCLAIALVIGSTQQNASETLDIPPWADKILFVMIFAGCIVGMIGMGFLGDVIGRKRGLILTSTLIVTGTLASAWFTWPGYYMWELLCLCRCIVGLGIGGVYPLSASSAAESDQKRPQANTAIDVAWSFFWQSPGLMAPYIVSLFLLASDVDHILAFRWVLSVGALPAIVVIAFTLDQTSSQVVATESSKLREKVMHKPYFMLLLGTGGTWLLFDVAYYGVMLFTPFILQAIFAQDARSLTPWELSVRTIWSALFGTIGTVCAVAFLRKWDAKTLNTFGFLAMGFCFSMLALLLYFEDHWWSSSDLKFFMFTLLLFSVNCGPNTATYVLPTQVFPPSVRSTFHGFSSGLGKIGAAIGACLYPELRSYDIPLYTLMTAQAFICFAGAVLSYTLLPDISQYSRVSGVDIDDNKSASTVSTPKCSSQYLRSRALHDSC